MWTVAGELSAQVEWHGLRVGSDLAVTLHSSDEKVNSHKDSAPEICQLKPAKSG